MREAAILEIGQSPVSDHWDKSLLEITGEPVLQIFEKTGINTVDSIFVGNMLCGTSNSQLHLGTYLCDWVGARHAEAIHVEAACASGAAAFRAALMAVCSGEADSAIAVGSEKMTDALSEDMTAALATAADSEYERDLGVTLPALAAMLMRRYMVEYGWEKEAFAPFAVNAHANAVHNPFARYRKAIRTEDYLRAPAVCDPVSVMDAAPICDGAAAVLIVPLDAVRAYRGVVRVLASSAACDTVAVGERKDPLWLGAVEKSSKDAYAQAGIRPQDVDLFEVHDAFTIMTALSLEAAGFAEPGTAPRLGLNGEIALDGRLPISTCGGLKARGHPVGATGLYQITEAVRQLNGLCGDGQIPNAAIAMTQNIGGCGAAVYTNIFALNDPVTR